MSSLRTSPYIQGGRGGLIDLLDPDPNEIVLAECAAALARINRYTGHAGVYSVAQHSIYAAGILQDRGHEPRVVAGALLHDFHEAWTGDVSTPVKNAVPEFRAFEDRHVRAVEARFQVSTRHSAIKAVDAELCVTEADQLLGGRIGPGWPDARPIEGLKITRWTPEEAERRFLAWAHNLRIS